MSRLPSNHWEDAMSTAKLATDPLWQCLCPSWTFTPLRRTARFTGAPTRPAPQCLSRPPSTRCGFASKAPRKQHDLVFNPLQKPSAAATESRPLKPPKKAPKLPREEIDLVGETTTSLYHLLQSAAIDGKTGRTREIAEVLVRDRRVQPTLLIYNALILSNISHDQGSAWMVMHLLQDLKQDGLEPDSETCHAVLKVLAVHVDHLLRTDILHFMADRWYPLSEDGAHDVAAGLFREGLFEQALRRLEMMREQGIPIQGWLLDMAIYTLSEANELPEAYRILRHRFDANEASTISRSVWLFFLDKASAARHAAGTSLVWTTQVQQSYLNPSSGICLNVLATASRAGDAVMATEVFTHLSKRGTAFKSIHYELLISAYLNLSPPDLKRALSILTIMPLEKIEPTATETRHLYTLMRTSPHLIIEALQTLRNLHAQGRKIPIAALNLLIECHVNQSDLSAALNLYKQIHTFVPLGEGARKSFANIETFNLLLKGCRVAASGPDAEQASFLVSELLALRIKPTALTYDRLMLVFVNAARQSSSPDTARRLLDWAYRHFADMLPLKWLPRFGTIEMLAVELARWCDERCWDLLQAGADVEDEGWGMRVQWMREKVERAWVEGEVRDESGKACQGEEVGRKGENVVTEAV